jgi:hypothetical protein
MGKDPYMKTFAFDQSAAAFREAQLRDPDIGPYLRTKEDRNYIPDGPLRTHILVSIDQFAVIDGILYRIHEPGGKEQRHNAKIRLALPLAFRQAALIECHDSLATGGHQGFDRTYAKLKERYWWPSCYEETKY